MFRKKSKAHRFYRREKKRSSKLLEISIVFLTVLLLIYAFSFFKKVSQSETSLEPAQGKESIFVRTQILNGSQKDGLADSLAHRLRGLRVNNIIYDVIETGNFEYLKPEQSLILDRGADEEKADLKTQTPCPSEIALQTAQALGIDKESVLCKKLENNYQEIKLTIVIGKDYQRLFKIKR
jgi:hypothetical protein